MYFFVVPVTVRWSLVLRKLCLQLGIGRVASRPMKNSIALGLSLFVLIGVAGLQTSAAATHSKTTRHSQTSKKSTSTKKVTATKLVDDALRANAYLVKSARADAGLDAQKAKNKPFWKAVESITTGLRWRRAHDPVTVLGRPTPADLEACWELGAALAAGLTLGA